MWLLRENLYWAVSLDWILFSAPTLHLFKWVPLLHMLMHVVLAPTQRRSSIKLKKVYIFSVPGQAFYCEPSELKLAKIECHHWGSDLAVVTLVEGVVLEWQSRVTAGLTMLCISLLTTFLAVCHIDMLLSSVKGAFMVFKLKKQKTKKTSKRAL